MDHNMWHGIGRLTKDPVYIPAGRKGDGHCTFTLASNRVVSNEQGPQADYVLCVLWGEEALRFIEIRSKGDEVGITGRIRTSNIPQADGSIRFHQEIRVEKVSYGRRSLRNLQPAEKQTASTQAVRILSKEFRNE